VSIDSHRLPGTVRPTRYQLFLDPDLAAGTFSGRVRIEVKVGAATGEVTLNADSLSITEARVEGPDGRWRTAGVRPDPDHERIHLGGGFDAGHHVLDLAFTGRFNEQLVGLYLSRFTDDDGAEQVLATTQFEATHARKCFPCFDEPALKARFEVTLAVDRAHRAVANTAEVSRTPAAGGRDHVRFAPTMVMSTYLLAFVVGPLEFTEPVDVGGVPLRVVHVPGKGHLTRFALDAGAFALAYFADYFDLPYPGDKLDLVAIPDFAFGAMENLGCVTFREVLLLIDPDNATQPDLQRVTDVITHELAHMWFGDLVTMVWWNGLWLNEAFATFMEMKCTDAWKPEWRRWVDFSLARTTALDIDALTATRPVEYEVTSPTDAEGMFDVLTYEKGAAVVRMLEQYLGEDRFREGIRRYMRDNAYGNAETTDLWDAIEAAVGEPVRRIMDSWIFQGGFPLVTAELGPGALTLSQQRFLLSDGGTEQPAAAQRWAVPVRWRTVPADGEPVTDRVLLDTQTTSVPVPAGVGAVVVNADATGFYRVRYPQPLLEELAAAADRLAPVERYALIDDAWAAVLAGQAGATGFLVLLESMTGEADRAVWVRIISGFTALHRLVDGPARDRLAGIVRDAVSGPLGALGRLPKPGEDDLTRQLRGDLFRAAGTLGEDSEVIDDARRIVAERGDGPDAAVLAASVDIVAAHGDEADFDTFAGAWRSAGTPQDEQRFLYALADFRHPELARRVQELVLSGAVRTQNAPYLLRRALHNRDHGRDAWRFITDNWDTLNQRLPSSSIVRMLEGITALDRPGDLAATRAFFAEHPVPQGAKTLEQLLERQGVQVALRQREADRLQRFLTG
jgi:puromycin-sensitive aminopeptidase